MFIHTLYNTYYDCLLLLTTMNAATIQKNSKMYEEQMGRYEEKIDSLSKESQDLKSTINKQKDEIQSLKDNTTQIQQSNEQEKQQLESNNKNEVTKLNQEYKSLNDKLQALQSQYDTTLEKLMTLQSMNDYLSTNNTKIDELNQSLTNELKELEAQLVNASSASKSQRDEIETLMNEITSLKQNLEEESKVAADTNESNIEAKTQLARDIIKVKSKSLKDLYDMEWKVSTLQMESDEKILELEAKLASYEMERLSLRKLMRLSLKRVGSIVSLQGVRKRMNLKKGKDEKEKDNIIIESRNTKMSETVKK